MNYFFKNFSLIILISTYFYCHKITANDHIKNSSNTIYLSIEKQIKKPIGSGEIIVRPPGILRIRDYNSKILISAKKLGTATIFNKNYKYKISVVPKKIYENYFNLKNLVKNMQGPKIKIKSKKIIIFGKILTLQDLKKISKLQIPFTLNASLSIKLKNQIYTYLKKELERNFLDSSILLKINWSSTASAIINPTNKELQNKITNLLAHHGINTSTSHNILKKIKKVKLTFFFIEISKDYLNKLGFSHPGSFHIQTYPKLTSVESIISTLNITDEQGQTKVLSKPILTVSHNQKSKFHSGGEIPVVQQTRNSKTTLWKKFGLEIEAFVKIDELDTIETSLKFSITSPNLSLSQNGVTGFSKTETETRLQIKNKHLVSISGLESKLNGISKDSTPIFNKIPLLNLFSSSKQKQQNQKKLLLLLHAQLI